MARGVDPVSDRPIYKQIADELRRQIETEKIGPGEKLPSESELVRDFGVAQGTIGWPTGAPSTLRYASKRTTGGKWVEPRWETMWFPHAFIGVMEQLQHAVKTGSEPVLSVSDNVRTMALVEAAYRSMAENRPVKLSEFAL